MSADDLATLAGLLQVPENDLRTAIGHGWHPATSPDGTPTWVGHVGPAVAITVTNHDICIGLACGDWIDNNVMVWYVSEPKTMIARGSSPETMLRALEIGAESASEVAKHSLITCRFCGETLAPEYAYSPNACWKCWTGSH